MGLGLAHCRCDAQQAAREEGISMQEKRLSGCTTGVSRLTRRFQRALLRQKEGRRGAKTTCHVRTGQASQPGQAGLSTWHVNILTISLLLLTDAEPDFTAPIPWSPCTDSSCGPRIQHTPLGGYAAGRSLPLLVTSSKAHSVVGACRCYSREV